MMAEITAGRLCAADGDNWRHGVGSSLYRNLNYDAAKDLEPVCYRVHH
jgi:hypothetical protein